MEPLVSHRTTRLGSSTARARRASSTSSPPWGRERRKLRRMSTTGPRADGTSRRLGRVAMRRTRAREQALHVAEVVRGALVEDLAPQEGARAVAGEVAVGVGCLGFTAAGPLVQFAADARERHLAVLVATPAPRRAAVGPVAGGVGKGGAAPALVEEAGRSRPTSGAGS